MRVAHGLAGQVVLIGLRIRNPHGEERVFARLEPSGTVPAAILRDARLWRAPQDEVRAYPAATPSSEAIYCLALAAMRWASRAISRNCPVGEVIWPQK